MTPEDADPAVDDPMVKSAREHAKRAADWQRDGEPPVGRRLAQIGVLGWIVVAPILMGLAAGRWIDGYFNTGLFWTAPLLMLGAVFRVLVCLEMDRARMISISQNNFNPWMDIPLLGAWLGLGAIVGVFYFRSLWRTTLWLSEAGHAGAIVILTIARFTLLIGVVVVACLQGALPLLATSLGLFAARFVVMRRIKGEIRGTQP